MGSAAHRHPAHHQHRAAIIIIIIIIIIIAAAVAGGPGQRPGYLRRIGLPWRRKPPIGPGQLRLFDTTPALTRVARRPSARQEWLSDALAVPHAAAECALYLHERADTRPVCTPRSAEWLGRSSLDARHP